MAGLAFLRPVGIVRVFEIDAAGEQRRQQRIHRQHAVLQLHAAAGGEQVEQFAGEAAVLSLRVDAVVRREFQFLDADHIGLCRCLGGKRGNACPAESLEPHDVSCVP
ncbi:hypothetical protein D3C80_1587150 [compost metagenome]